MWISNVNLLSALSYWYCYIQFVFFYGWISLLLPNQPCHCFMSCCRALFWCSHNWCRPRWRQFWISCPAFLVRPVDQHWSLCWLNGVPSSIFLLESMSAKSGNLLISYRLLSGLAFSALTLLVAHQEEHLACKNWVMRCWRDCLSGVRCKWLAYGAPCGLRGRK